LYIFVRQVGYSPFDLTSKYDSSGFDSFYFLFDYPGGIAAIYS